MPDLSSTLRIAILTLSLFQFAQLLLRLRPGPSVRYAPRRPELLGLAGFVALVGLRAALDPAPAGRAAAGFLLLWSAGGVLGRMAGIGRRRRWDLAVAGLGATLLALGAVGFAGTVPFRALSLFSCVLALLYPLRLLLRLWGETRHPAFLLLLLPALLWIPAAALALGAGAGPPPLEGPLPSAPLGLCLLLLAGTGWLAAAGGGQPLPGVQERRIQGIRHRLIQTENTLLLQDRLVASGLLTAGAAHEFKNLLADIALAAEHGLAVGSAGAEPKALLASLQAVARQAEVGRRAVMGLLDALLRHGRPDPEPIRLRQDLDGLLKLVRASYRPEGIRVESDLPPDMAVLCRRGELEQVLLNLIRNAAESLRRRPGAAPRTIRLTAEPREGAATLEVLDDGPGVLPDLAERIFEESFSGAGSSGLGLYLSRMLAERNGGRLECLPRPEGGRFRLTLPLPWRLDRPESLPL